MTTSPIITLTTDFGNLDGFVGIVKGVILSISPQATIVDISHELEPFDIQSCAWITSNTYKFFPSHTIHVAVVDPGVGSPRKAILVKCPRGIFIGPDNGWLSLVLQQEKECQCYELTNSALWLSPVSASFHARDIFAPVAAHVADGLELKQVGPPISVSDLTKLPAPSLKKDLHGIEGQIVYIDHFGNLITNIPAEIASDNCKCFLEDKMIGGLGKAYASTDSGNVIVIAGSHGYLEIAVNRGQAKSVLQGKIGSTVKLEFDR